MLCKSQSMQSARSLFFQRNAQKWRSLKCSAKPAVRRRHLEKPPACDAMKQHRWASDAVKELLQQLSQGGLGGKSESKQDDAWTEELRNAAQVSEQECGLVNKTHRNIKSV